jgi:hypothetical protein
VSTRPATTDETVLAQLHACGVTDEEIASGGEVVDVDSEAVYAWLEGRAPCPVPLSEASGEGD